MLPASSSKPSEDEAEWLDVPVVIGEQSFDEERQAELSEIFDRGAKQLVQHTADWQETVKRMRDNFVKLHPVDVEHPAAAPIDNYVVVDSEKMRTLFFEYPSADAGDQRPSSPSREGRPPAPTRYQLRFDLLRFVPASVTVTAELAAVVVRATSTSPGGGQCCAARVPVPPAVRRDRLRAFLSADGVLTVEAPLLDGDVPQPSADKDEVSDAGSKWKRAKAAVMKAGDKTTGDAEKRGNGNTNTTNDIVDGQSGNAAVVDASKNSTSPTDATSPAEGQASAPSKEKVGVPIFRDELGTRRMYLAVELGTIYRPRDVIIQVVKENRIQIRAKNYEKTTERQSKNKFTKDYELGEKIELFSLQGGLTAEGKLIISAYAKGHGPADEFVLSPL